MCFIGVEVEQETSTPPPKKNPGSAPGDVNPALNNLAQLFISFLQEHQLTVFDAHFC